MQPRVTATADWSNHKPGRRLANGRAAGFLSVAAIGATTGLALVGAVCYATNRIQSKARVEARHVPNGPYEAIFKRPIDVALSAGALVVLSPVMLTAAIAVRLKLGSPILFTQKRPGLNTQLFKLYKFRTMTDERNLETGNMLPDSDRLTSFGRKLRSTSVDELPELLNVLKGDMSLIGPRPLLASYLPYYTEEEGERHSVRPGLTGLAQINGRNNLGWNERFALDVQYADNITLISDATIFFKTFGKLFHKSDIMENALMNLDEARSELDNDR